MTKNMALANVDPTENPTQTSTGVKSGLNDSVQQSWWDDWHSYRSVLNSDYDIVNKHHAVIETPTQ